MWEKSLKSLSKVEWSCSCLPTDLCCWYSTNYDKVLGRHILSFLQNSFFFFLCQKPSSSNCVVLVSPPIHLHQSSVLVTKFFEILHQISRRRTRAFESWPSPPAVTNCVVPLSPLPSPPILHHHQQLRH